MWCDKHGPDALEGFIGNKAKEAIEGWDGSKPLLVHGGTGCGKTLLGGLAAEHKGWDLHVVTNDNIANAADIGNTMGLFGGKKLLFLDDVETIKDIKAVPALIKNCASPIMLSTSDLADKRLATVKRSCQDLQLRRALPASIANHLAVICEKEGIGCDKEALSSIAKSAKGDIRAAILDLQYMAAPGEPFDAEDVDGKLSARDGTSDIYRALSVIFGGRDYEKVVKSTWDLSMQQRDILWWVDENVPRLYQDMSSIAGCYENLSRADIFLGRIMRRQYWGFLRYSNVLMTAGVNSERPARINFTQYRFPGYFASLGRTKGMRGVEDKIASKMGHVLHVSKRVAKLEYIPMYQRLLGKGFDEMQVKELYRFDPAEMEYLTG